MSQIGAKRRMRALTERGWSPEAVQRATGIPAGDIERMAGGRAERVTPEMIGEASLAYELLWNVPPPENTTAERVQAAAARDRARIRSWAPPAAWDDEDLEDPAGKPAAGWRRGRGSATRVEDLMEDIAWIREHGGYRLATRQQLAMRLGKSRAALDQALLRAQRKADTGAA